MTDWLLLIAGILTALGVVFGAVIAVYKVAKRVEDAVGVDDAGRTLADRMDRVEHQLWPNGGSSLADKVSKVDREVTETRSEVGVIKDMLTAVLHRP